MVVSLCPAVGIYRALKELSGVSLFHIGVEMVP